MDSEDIEWVNRVIRGVVKFRKCPSCDVDGVGLIAYNEDGELAKDGEESYRELCEDCNSLGFVEVPS